MKFKVGDKVKVVKICDNDAKRKQYIGKTFVIRAVNPNGMSIANTKGTHYSIGESYVVYEDELQLILRTPFTKADLKDGMVVECRYGKKYLVLNNRIMTNNTNIPLSVYTENMIHPHCDDESIDKVYISTTHFLEYIFNNECLTLIWERPKEEPAKKMTVEEIEKELGYKVEIVSDSNNQ